MRCLRGDKGTPLTTSTKPRTKVKPMDQTDIVFELTDNALILSVTPQRTLLLFRTLKMRWTWLVALSITSLGMIDYCIMKVPSNLVKTQFLAKWHQGALDHDGKPMSTYDHNPFLNTLLYEVAFPDVQAKEYRANIVVEICWCKLMKMVNHWQWWRISLTIRRMLWLRLPWVLMMSSCLLDKTCLIKATKG